MIIGRDDIASKKDLLSYFKKKEVENNQRGTPAKKLKTAEIIASATDNVSTAELEIIKDEIHNQVRRSSYHTNVPARIKREVAQYASVNGTKAALNP